MSDAPEPGPPPVLVVQGLGSAAQTPLGIVSLWFAVGGLTWCFGSSILFPAFTRLVKSGTITDEQAQTLIPIVTCGGPLLLAFVGSLASLWRHRRSGKVEFFEDRIVVTRGGRPTTFAWQGDSGVVAYRDGSSDVVELVRSGALSSSVFVPTPDEPARTRVLALLDARGLKRLDA